MDNKEINFKAVVAEVKMAYSISDYIRQAGVSLTASGLNQWKGLCPFHSENTASFRVNDHFQSFRCFGCGASGDLLNYVMRTENLEFFEALKKLAEDKGIEIATNEGAEDRIDYKSLRACLKDTANFFVKEFRKLPEEHVAKKQVLDRGLTLNKMLYGYAPENRTALYDYLKSLKYSDEIILAAGVATKWEDTGKFSDFWSGRLMFFITDVAGKPIGFAGRKLFEGDKRGKFVNSQAGPLFDKSSALFNIQNAKKPAADNKEIYIAEGQFDVAAFIEAGMENTVAASGTAFTYKQGQILQRSVGENGKIIFAFDGDAAGVKAAIKVFTTAPLIHSSSHVVVMPEGLDPCDYRKDNGNSALVDLASNNRVPLVEFVLNSVAKDLDMDTELGRANYLDKSASVLATIASQALREQHIRKVSLEGLSDVETVRSLVTKAEPLQLRDTSQDNEEIKTDVERVYVEEDVKLTEEALIELIEADKLYNLSARFIALTVVKPELIQYLPKNVSKLPKEFTLFVNELCSLPAGSSIMPELFSEPNVAEYFITTNYFPLAHIEAFDARDQFKFLYKEIVNFKKIAEENRVQAKIAKIIASSNHEGAEFFEKALEREEQELAKLA